MDALRILLSRIFALARRQKLDRELDEELRAHIDCATEENLRRGMPPREARATALIDFGGVTQIKENYRMRRGLPLLEQAANDLKFGLRQLFRNRGFTLTALLTLALGIGATTTVYSVIHAVLIDPYPYVGANRIVHLHLYDKEPFPDDLALNRAQFKQFLTSPALDGAVMQDQFPMSSTGEEFPSQVDVVLITPNAFQFFGVPALLGREFGPSDNNRVAVLSFHYWKSHYASRRDVVGKTIQLDHQDYAIIGVLPERFAWWGSDVYTPLPDSNDPARIANVFARIQPGWSYQAVEQALQPMLDAFAKETPKYFPQKFKVHLVRINDIATGRFAGVLLILFVSVLFLLLLGCVNVAILLLARGEARRPEIAMRKALGASRARIVVQLLAETLILSLSGGLLGVMLAVAGIHLVRAYLPHNVFPAEAQIFLNLPVLLFSLAASLLTSLAAGLWPALLVSRTSLRQAAEAVSGRHSSAAAVRKTHMSLLAVQVALTVLLLACSGATVQKLWQLIHADLGYDPHHLMLVNIAFRDGALPHWQERINYDDQIHRAVAAIPAIQSAAIVEFDLPPSILDSVPVSISGSTSSSDGHVTPLEVSANFFSTSNIPLLRGRAWTDAEIAHADRLAVINAAMQRRYWPSIDPIGQTFILNNGIVAQNIWTLAAPGNNGKYQVIGVVGDTPNRGLGEPVAPGVYLPYTLRAFDSINLALRSDQDPAKVLHAVREEIHRIDASQAVGNLVTATDLLERDSLARERFIAWLFTAFAVLALSFAASGLFSILSYLTSQRVREFGIRIALGAQRRHIVRLLTVPSAVAVFVGCVFGLAANYACGRIFAQWTSGNARDPLMLACMVALLLIVALLASLVPSFIAASTEPMRALKAE